MPYVNPENFNLDILHGRVDCTCIINLFHNWPEQRRPSDSRRKPALQWQVKLPLLLTQVCWQGAPSHSSTSVNYTVQLFSRKNCNVYSRDPKVLWEAFSLQLRHSYGAWPQYFSDATQLRWSLS